MTDADRAPTAPSPSPDPSPDPATPRVALVVGESEIADGNVVVKDLRSGEQTTVTQESVAAHLRTLLG